MGNSITLKKSRESNFELLRLLAMFLIVLSHFVVHGVYPYWQQNVSTLNHLNNIIALLFCTGKIGVTLFVLLTGYFSCKQDFRLKKWLDVYLKTLFFSVLCLVIYFFIDTERAITGIGYSIFPFVHNSYWFITSWLLLYAFSPFLNVILHKFSPKTLQKYLILGLIIWGLFPIMGFNGMGESELIWFMYLYILGGAIRLKHVAFSKKFLFYCFLGTFCFVFAMLMVEVWPWFDIINLNAFSGYAELNKFYTLFTSLWLFCFFKDLKVKSSLINWLASSAFSVYLLHDNNLIRPWLWHTQLDVSISMNSPYFILWAIIVSLSVFGLCVIIDKLLSFFYKPLINYAENKILKLTQPTKKVFGILSKITSV